MDDKVYVGLDILQAQGERAEPIVETCRLLLTSPRLTIEPQVTLLIQKEGKTMLSGKRIAILAEDDFEDLELIEPVGALKDSGAMVLIVGSGSQETYRGKRGRATVRIDTTADKVKAEDFDAIVIPGGYAADKMRLYQPMVDLVRKAYDLGKVVAAICHGPQLLISAGIVKGHRITSWPSVAVDLRNAGADWIDAPLVQDGNLITSRKPADLPRFNKAIIEALETRPVNSRI